MAEVTMINLSPKRTLDEPKFYAPDLTVLDAFGRGGAILSMSLNPNLADQGLMLELSRSETLWLVSTLTEALHAGLADNEYEATLATTD